MYMCIYIKNIYIYYVIDVSSYENTKASYAQTKASGKHNLN